MTVHPNRGRKVQASIAPACTGTQRHDHLNLQDVSSRGAGQSPSGVEVAKAPPATPCTPQECATMVDAVEQAIKDAHDHTPGTLVPMAHSC